MSFSEQFSAAKNASYLLASKKTEEKNIFLQTLADILEKNTDRILLENKKDIDQAKKNGLGSMVDRLLLTPERITAIASEARNIATLEDEGGKILSSKKMPNGLLIEHKRVPLGVVGMIYESRPNVTIDAASLAIKSGNAIVLKGGKEAIFSNRVLVQILQEALSASGFPKDAVQFLDTIERRATQEMLEAKGLIDILIPRGGRGLIAFVNEHAKIPCIETGASVVHTFIDKSADLKMAIDIVWNEKTRRTSVCNALDTILIHENVADDFLSAFSEKLQKSPESLEIYADENSFQILQEKEVSHLSLAKEEDYSTEWLDMTLSIRIVSDFDTALKHIRTYSLGHSESIVTEDKENAERFLNEVDAACVYWNASTCFSDGAQFGLGAEIGISTQKLHVRGPFALQGLTSTKWVIKGEGQIRS